jgi:putative transposase
MHGGLRLLSDAITTVWEFAVVQACIIHPIRKTFRFASRKYWDQIAHDLRPVYTAAPESEAKARFEEFEEKWSKLYPAAVKCSGQYRFVSAAQNARMTYPAERL